MDQDAKARVPISNYTHKLTNKPQVVAATRQNGLKKRKQQLNNKSETHNYRRHAAFGPLIGLIWGFRRMCITLHYCELRYLCLIQLISKTIQTIL